MLGDGRHNTLINLATADELVRGDHYFVEARTVLDDDLDPLSVRIR